jgi:hypothetical protein
MKYYMRLVGLAQRGSKVDMELADMKLIGNFLLQFQ